MVKSGMDVVRVLYECAQMSVVLLELSSLMGERSVLHGDHWADATNINLVLGNRGFA